MASVGRCPVRLARCLSTCSSSGWGCKQQDGWGRVFCTAPEDDIPPLLAYFSFFQAVANIRPPTLPYWISISITIKEDGHKTPEEKAAQSENKFTASTSNIVHKAISRLISNLLQGTDDRNYFNGEGGGEATRHFHCWKRTFYFLLFCRSIERERDSRNDETTKRERGQKRVITEQ
jgi:hypothetical protein